MKKMNSREADMIVGGCGTTCTDAYGWVDKSGKIECNRITTCVDKYGCATKSYSPASFSSCAANAAR